MSATKTVRKTPAEEAKLNRKIQANAPQETAKYSQIERDGAGAGPAVDEGGARGYGPALTPQTPGAQPITESLKSCVGPALLVLIALTWALLTWQVVQLRGEMNRYGHALEELQKEVNHLEVWIKQQSCPAAAPSAPSTATRKGGFGGGKGSVDSAALYMNAQGEQLTVLQALADLFLSTKPQEPTQRYRQSVQRSEGNMVDTPEDDTP